MWKIGCSFNLFNKLSSNYSLKEFMKKIFTCLLVFIFPFYAFATFTCNSAGGGNNSATAITMLDNNTHNNCVDADVAAWAIDKIYFYTLEDFLEGQEITKNFIEKSEEEIKQTKELKSFIHGILIKYWPNLTLLDILNLK